MTKQQEQDLEEYADEHVQNIIINNTHLIGECIVDIILKARRIATENKELTAQNKELTNRIFDLENPPQPEDDGLPF